MYQIVQQHLETFLAEPQLHGAAGYPPFIEREFRRYLDCGILSRGMVRIRCGDCGRKKVVAMSCKSRSLCPSCVGRRMTDTASQLRDRLLPKAPYRQWVLSFPYTLRIHLARDQAFFSEMLRGLVRTIFCWQRRRGRDLGLTNGQPAAVLFLHRFGSAIQLTPHAHVVAPDGLWLPGSDQDQTTMTFAELAPPTDQDVVALTRKVARRLTRVAQRYLGDNDDDCVQWHDPDDEQAARDHCLQAAIRAPVRPPPPSLPFIPSPPSSSPTTSSKPLCASVNGFSMHAATCVSQDDRDALERLCKYGLRAPIAQDRLSVLSDGRVRYELRHPWPTAHGATTELTFEPLQFMRRLAAIIPVPYTNMVRYYGCFASRSKFRTRLPQTPEAQSEPSEDSPRHHAAAANGASNATGQDDDAQLTFVKADDYPLGGETDVDAPVPQTPAPRTRRTPWAVLLKRAFGIDALRCDCGAQMVVMAMITDVKVLEKILNHLRLPATPPPIAPARMDPQEDLDLDLHHAPAEEGDAYLDEYQHPHGRLAHHRAPP